MRGPVKVGNIRMTVDFALKEFFLRDDCERLDNSSVSYSNPARDRVENSRKDFVNEARRLKKIGFSHPNIVSFDEVFEANNTAYYVMEYLRGKSLGDYVTEKGQLSEEETLSLLKPVMEAVEMLHQNRVCHLDIKPDNIMLEPTDDGSVRPVLIDFGLSKHYTKRATPPLPSTRSVIARDTRLQNSTAVSPPSRRVPTYMPSAPRSSIASQAKRRRAPSTCVPARWQGCFLKRCRTGSAR